MIDRAVAREMMVESGPARDGGLATAREIAASGGSGVGFSIPFYLQGSAAEDSYLPLQRRPASEHAHQIGIDTGAIKSDYVDTDVSTAVDIAIAVNAVAAKVNELKDIMITQKFIT